MCLRRNQTQEGGPLSRSGFQRAAVLVIFLTLLAAGCSRERYRSNADQEVYSLLNTVHQSDPLWEMDGFSLDEDAQSRYSSPYDPDHQPMPQDDSTAHKLMQCVDGKKGSPKWYENGCVDSVENENWMASLPIDEDGKMVVDQDAAFDLAILHSPDYRTALENVYMAALDVTAERFAFDTKFYGGESLFFNNRGGFRKDSTSTLTNTLDSGDGSGVATRKFATGADLIVNIANSMVWTFGPDGQSFNPVTRLSYSFTQPFLRGAGRQIILESLTRSERQLLANVRQLAFYQQGFYVGVLTGTYAIRTPASSGYPGKQVSSVSGSGGGYYGLLSDQVQIRNQQAQVESLKENLDQYEEFFKAGRLQNSMQVEQVRENLLSGQSTLVNQKNSYQNSIENYLISLGLPPDIQNVTIEDALLDQFTLMSPTLTQFYEELGDQLSILRNRGMDTPPDLAQKIGEYREAMAAGIQEVADDFAKLDAVVPNRKSALETLMRRLEEEHPELDSSFCDLKTFEAKIEQIKKDYVIGKESLDDIFRLMELTILKYDPQTLADMIHQTRENPSESPFSEEVIALVRKLQMTDIFDREQELKEVFDRTADLKNDPVLTGDMEREKDQNETVFNIKEPYRYWVCCCLTDLSEKLTTIRLIQTRARLETVELSIVDLDSDTAFEVARENRFDWMNARSELVDTWRDIEIVANKLKGYLNLNVGGSIQNEGSNPVNFSAKNAEFNASVAFDAPLTRLLERNDYRRALITYDRARRSYYNYVDNVNMQIRQTIRGIFRNQMELELKREAVRVAVVQVHLAQLKLIKPPGATKANSIGDQSARDLTNALNSLLSSQNSFMNTWLDYQVQRMALLLELGLFQLDENGKWVDPGPINRALLSRTAEAAGPIPQDQLAGMDELRNIEDLTGGIPIETLESIPTIEQEVAVQTP